MRGVTEGDMVLLGLGRLLGISSSGLQVDKRRKQSTRCDGWERAVRPLIGDACFSSYLQVTQPSNQVRDQALRRGDRSPPWPSEPSHSPCSQD